MYIIGIDINGSADALWTEDEQVSVFETLGDACAALNAYYLEELQDLNDGFIEAMTLEYRLFEVVPHIDEWFIPETCEYTGEILKSMGVGIHELT